MDENINIFGIFGGSRGTGASIRRDWAYQGLGLSGQLPSHLYSFACQMDNKGGNLNKNQFFSIIKTDGETNEFLLVEVTNMKKTNSGPS